MQSPPPSRKFARSLGKIFSAGVQAAAVQVLSALFFFYISRHLSKEAFGIISWANATALTLVTMLSFGLEQIVLRRIAANGASSYWTAGAFFLHTTVTSALVLPVLLLAEHLDGSAKAAALPGFFLVQSLLGAALPVRLLLNARQLFAPYAVVALLSNAARLAGAWWALHHGLLSVPFIIRLLAICAAAELAAALLYGGWRAGFRLQLRRRAYTRLLKEAAPQYLSVLFDSLLSRADWILLGLIGMEKTVATADYSFAYRAFEMARLPLVVVGMVLMPRLAPLLRRDPAETRLLPAVSGFFRLEMAGASLMALLLCLLWTPLVGSIFAGKYGAANAPAFWLLAAALPVQFAINLMWQLCFTARQYRPLARITACAALTNLAANLCLIPALGSQGAATAYLLASLIQAALYFSLTRKLLPGFGIRPLLANLLPAVFIFSLVLAAGWPLWPSLLAASAGHLLLSALLRGWRPDDLRAVKRFLQA